MADKEHLVVVDRGVTVWNDWRRHNPDLEPDLSSIDLREANLQGANLRKTNFYRTSLYKANLQSANLYRAYLREAILIGANLHGANLYESTFFDTVFLDTDLREAKGLDLSIHHGPSFIDHRTLKRSGTLPESFLRGCGLPEEFMKYIPELFWTSKEFSFYSCFISYSHKDEEFAEQLHHDLQNHGVRCWFAPEDIKIGDKIRPIIDQYIELHDKLLIILSEASVRSTWVEHEVEAALHKEAEQKTIVLFPIRLDSAILDSKVGWAAKIKRERHIGDFSEWKDQNSYKKAIERLLRDLHTAELYT